ncbi:MAG: hypothetical protein FJ217_11365 [Ignavibacteria bacterium]|nr:hypothetical protein [Ignavibacteria bacterium]
MMRRFSRYFCSLALVWAWLSSGSFAQGDARELESRLRSNPDDQEALMELGRIYHDQAVNGDDAAVEKGFRCFDKLVALDSANAVAVVYRGSFWTMRARDAWWPPTKLKYMRQGGKEMDQAVEMAPDNIMVRLIRGINSLSLPSLFGRLETALEDFIVLLRHPDFPDQTRELKTAIFYYGGVAYKRVDELDKARELFQRSIATLPGSDFARRAQEELDDMDS